MRISHFLMLVLFSVPASAGPPAPGALIDVGGYRLHVACEGYGTPTVVFDVGLGGSSLEWRAVIDEVRRFTRVCTYDRAGYGWSDMGPLPRTSSTIVNELYLLLEAVDFEKPFMLVGHSYGGYNMQLFARRYPYLVAGIVLVDSSHPAQVERFLEPPIGLNTVPSTRWGMVRFGEPPKPHRSLSDRTRRLIRNQMNRWRTRRTLAEEFLGFRDSARELRNAQALIAMPIVVVSRGKRVWPHDSRGNLLENLWVELQSELAAQSPWSAHIVARDSGHHVHLDQPKLIAYSVAVITDIYRSQQAGGAGVEHQELTVRAHIDFRAAAWLQDSLVMQALADIPVVTMSRTPSAQP
ncbi:MAG: alpha/beta hydrolase [Gammaproteobacteria bacterium]|jgi:pimeloyl-ACP methyl ester carboxylesterase|nr:alpha/beta hydrolase [Gammaproteobacteria bacterium]